jgi:glycosyltransferase involved in cell wall biosynthesis
MIRVLHTTMSLGAGGVERLLSDILPLFDPTRVVSNVVLLRDRGFRAEGLRRRGIDVRALGGRGIWDLAVLKRFQEAVDASACDILHAHLVWPSVAAALVKGARRLIWHVHDSPESLSVLHGLAERCFIRRSDAVIAVSEPVARFIRNRYPWVADRVHCLPNAILPGDVLPRRADGPPTIGFLGRLDEPKKGVMVLLRTVRRVADRCPDVRFVIAGDGPSRTALQRDAAALGVASHVEWVGEVTNPSEVLSRFDVLVLPSLWEGSPMVLLEAMAAGRAVVASNVGGIPDLLVDGKTGRLVPPGDDALLAEALLSIVTSPDRGCGLGEAGRRRVLESFSADGYVRRLEAIYEGVLAK